MYQKLLWRMLVCLACVTIPFFGYAENSDPTEDGCYFDERHKNDKTKVGFVTGSKDGTYYDIVGDINDVVNRDFSFIIKTSKGSKCNVIRMASGENTSVGIVQSDVMMTLLNDKNYKDEAKKLRVLAPLYQEEIHIFASQEIQNTQDLRGKSVAIGVEQSGSAMTAENLFRHLGMRGEVSLYNESVDISIQKVLKGTLDAVLYVAGKPASYFKELNSLDKATTKNFHFVEIASDKFKDQPYVKSQLTTEDYQWLTEPSQTLAVQALLTVYDFSRSNSDYARTRCQQFKHIITDLKANLLRLQEGDDYHPKWDKVDLNNPIKNWERDTCAWNSISLVTGSKNGTYYKMAKNIAEISQGVLVEVKTSKGAEDNIKRMNSIENVAMGIVQSDVMLSMQASKREDRGDINALRVVAGLHNEEIHVLARESITNFTDLKRIAIGVQGSGSNLTAKNLFRMLDMTPKYEEIQYKAALNKLKAGTIDAMIIVAGKPASLFVDYLPELFSEDQLSRLHFLPLDDSQFKGNDKQAYVNSRITKAEYDWVDRSVNTLAVKAVLVANDFSSENTRYHRRRCDQIHDVASALREELDKLQSQDDYHPKWKEVNLFHQIGHLPRSECALGNP